MTTTTLEMLKRFEGFSAEPYTDSVGVLTVGYGRNLEANPFTPEEAEVWLTDHYLKTVAELARRGWEPLLNSLTEPRREALCQMAYQLGVPRLLGFQRMLAALRRKDWQAAHDEALDSKWARQDPDRAAVIAEMLLSGAWPSALTSEAARRRLGSDFT